MRVTFVVGVEHVLKVAVDLIEEFVDAFDHLRQVFFAL
jgi:hypothetical protein